VHLDTAGHYPPVLDPEKYSPCKPFLIVIVPGVPYSPFGRAKLWSAAACCRFPPHELARGNFDGEHNSPPASWLATKRQQAAALQSFAQNAMREASLRNR
jgi:hypothetical protein